MFLTRDADHQRVEGRRNTSGGHDVIVFNPNQPLDPDTAYTFRVTDRVMDESHISFVPETFHFRSGKLGAEATHTFAFEKVDLPGASGQNFTCLTFGPDGRLYAAALTGQIVSFAVASDGALGAPQIITTIQNLEGATNRALVGITFDPRATADNLILWASHSAAYVPGAPRPAAQTRRVRPFQALRRPRRQGRYGVA